MTFSLPASINILERTPNVLIAMLESVPEDWTMKNEGGDSWSVYDIIGHLIHGEKTDWIPRTDIILSDEADKTFSPFDRFAQFESSEGKPLVTLLQEFKSLREANIAYLKSLDITAQDLVKTGNHPALGKTTLGELLATWTVHDLGHIAQIARVIAKQYKTEVGPWIEYLGILK